MQPSNELHEVIKNRYSPMVFQDKEISDRDLSSMLEAARWAPSSFNEQPWRFIVGKKGSETWQMIFDTLTEGNQDWADTAPLLMVSVAKLTFDFDGRPNRHAYHDVGLAVGNMITQATALDIYAHQMAGFNQMQVRQSFEIPDGFDPVAVIAFGYEGDIDTLSGDLQERAKAERERNPLSELVFSGKWGDDLSISS